MGAAFAGGEVGTAARPVKLGRRRGGLRSGGSPGSLRGRGIAIDLNSEPNRLE